MASRTVKDRTQYLRDDLGIVGLNGLKIPGTMQHCIQRTSVSKDSRVCGSRERRPESHATGLGDCRFNREAGF